MRSTSAVSAEYVGSASPLFAAIAASRPATADSTSSSRCIGAPNKSASTRSMRPVRSAASRPNRAANPPGRNRAPTTVPRSLIVVRNTRSTTPCTSVFGSEKPWRGLSLPHSWVMCSDGNVITVLASGSRPRRSQLTDQKCSTKRPASTEGAHRSRSNNDVEPARPTTPRSGGGLGFVLSCTHAIQVTKGAHSSGKPMPRRAACPVAKNCVRRPSSRGRLR